MRAGTAGSRHEFLIGATTDTALAAFRRHWSLFLLLPAIARLPSALALWRNLSFADGGGDRHSILQNLDLLQASSSNALANVAVILDGVLAIVAQAAMFRAAFGAMSGREEGWLESLRLGTLRFWPLFGTGLLLGLGLIVGLVLLVVPGIILLTMWFVSSPACVIEGVGPIRSLRRSAELTKGHRLKILGIALLVLLVYLTVYMVTLAIVSLAFSGVMALVAMEYVLQVLSVAGSVVFIVAIYHDLRAIDERTGPPMADVAV